MSRIPELETGETTLAFAASELADLHFEGGVIPAAASARPLGVEIAFVTQDVAGAHVRAVNAGATQLSAPRPSLGARSCPMSDARTVRWSNCAARSRHDRPDPWVSGPQVQQIAGALRNSPAAMRYPSRHSGFCGMLRSNACSKPRQSPSFSSAA